MAAAVAGGALAAAGQHVLTQAVPAAADGANVLRMGVSKLFGDPTTGDPATQAQASAAIGVDTASPAAQSVSAFSPVAPEPAVADSVVPERVVADPVVAGRIVADPAVADPAVAEPVVADAAALVKAADLHRVAAETAARAAAAAKAAEAARAAEARTAVNAVDVVDAARPAATNMVAAAGGAVQMILGRVSSGFGARGGAAHQGLDIAAPIGTPIRAPLAGTVISSGPASGFGLWVRLRHADGTITVYGHINRSLVNVGQQVQAGQVIAEVGNRGQSTGPHLHIEVMTGGKKINPRPWLDQHGIGYLA